ncbi:MAG TPA: hypothetical protein VML50_16880 [Anaeromyxobacter sp.]|nr:hypothetical protein [Anaeromyxobacter sp.]
MASIVAYLTVNPSAADTLDGIHAVWLGGAATRETVEAAVEALVVRGAMVCRTLPDGSVLFAGPSHPGS